MEEKKKNKGGRPKKQIDVEQFKKLCQIQCTKEEIAGFFDCHEDTIDSWCKNTFGECFSLVHKKNSQGGKISLRRYQFKLAQTNASMAIFLGKQYLGQTDKVENVNSFEDLQPLADLLKGKKNANN